ncbi:MAG: hypothetical protein ABMB14_33285 [Myxococcota bacterium]
MTRIRALVLAVPVAVGVIAIGITTGIALSSDRAAAAESRVICTQVPQRPGQIDEQFVANFMSEQLAGNHQHFTTVTGVSTVLCAW